MRIDFNSLIPIYVQIADAIEDDILAGQLKEGENCYSQVVLAKQLEVNPATAAKGINVLVSRGILQKQRGQAMVVALDAILRIKKRKQTELIGDKVKELVQEAKKLGVTQE